MSKPIINQPWEDVSADVCAAIQAAVQPLLKKAVDDIYGGLLDTTQDYLTENLAFNIASRIDTAEREARRDREMCAAVVEALQSIADLPGEINPSNYNDDDVMALNNAHIAAFQIAIAALAKARGAA